MKKIISRFIIFIISIILIFFIYLSTFGIKTNKLNKQISNQINNINQNFEIDLKDVSIALDPIRFKLNLKTLGANLNHKNKTIKLERVKSSISLKSLINNQFSLKELKISTKSVEIKNIISFIRTLKNDPSLYILEKFIKRGFLIADIDLEFDQNGNIKNNYNINGYVKEGKIDFIKKYNLSKIDFIFNYKKDELSLDDIKLSLNGKKLELSNFRAKKEKEKFKISGKLLNKKDVLDKKEINELFNGSFFKFPINEITFSSENLFSFEIDKKFKFQNLKIDSKINIDELILKNEFNLDKIFPNIKKEIVFTNHKIDFKYNKKIWNAEGLGEFLSNEKDKIEYNLNKNGNNISFRTIFKINESPFKIDSLHYQKKDKSNLIITANGKNDLKDKFYFEKITLLENDNKIFINELSLSNNFEIKELKKILFDYVDRDKFRNNISITKKK